MAGKNYPPAEVKEIDADIPQKELPSTLLSFLPIVVPLLLITIKSLLNLVDKGGQTLISKIFFFPGEPIFALAIGVVLAMFLIRKKQLNR